MSRFKRVANKKSTFKENMFATLQYSGVISLSGTFSECSKSYVNRDITGTNLSNIKQLSPNNKERSSYVVNIFDQVKHIPCHKRPKKRPSRDNGNHRKTAKQKAISTIHSAISFEKEIEIPDKTIACHNVTTVVGGEDIQISWSSSNEESESDPKIPPCTSNSEFKRLKGCRHSFGNILKKYNNHSSFLNKKTVKSPSSILNKFKNTVEEEDFQISWSSSNEGSDHDAKSSKSKHINSSNECKIVWSSSESDTEPCIDDSCYQNKCYNDKDPDPEYELNLFVLEIEKDLKRTNKIKEKYTIKSGTYVERFQNVIRKTKMNLGFLDYETNTGIIKGTSGVVTKKELLYGVCTIDVEFENATNCCFILDKSVESVKVGDSIISFVDASMYYVVNDHQIFVQPNKVLRDK